MNERLIRPNDVTNLLKAMEELFKEQEDVTPKQVSVRMSDLCGRPIHFQYVGFVTHSFGFSTMPVTSHQRPNQVRTTERIFVKDYALLEKLKKDLPNIEATCKANNTFPQSSCYSYSPSKLNIMTQRG